MERLAGWLERNGRDGWATMHNEQGLRNGRFFFAGGQRSWVRNALGGPIDYDVPANTRLNSQFSRVHLSVL